MTRKLDSIDRVLLDGIQEDGRMAQSELGKRANLSTAAVNRRLKQLHRTGVIEGYTARLNAKALGYNLTIIVEVDVERERADLLNEMQQMFKACPEIQQCYYVAGECDFVLILLVRDMEQYVTLARELFHENGNVKAFKTLVAMDCVKTGAQVPVKEN